MNPVFEADYIDRMFAKCHEDFVKDPLNTSYLIVVPELRDAPWYKRWVKYYDIVDKHPRGSKLFSTKAAHAFPRFPPPIRTSSKNGKTWEPAMG